MTEPRDAVTYAAAGVDLERGDAASRLLYQAAQQTWQQRRGRFGAVIIPHDDFSGMRAIEVGSLPPGIVMGIGFDGIGSKIEIAERLGVWDTLAHDLFAMVCDDAVTQGAEPVLVGTVLDVNRVDLNAVAQLAEGYVSAAAAAGVAVLNGELAECGSRLSGYGPFTCSWGAGVVWFARRDRLLSGAALRAGDAIVGLAESGCRSNGYTLLRQILQRVHGDDWHTVRHGDTTLGELALQPSRIFAKAIVDMLGGIDGEPQAPLHGVVHVTGGGVPGKLGRLLRRANLGADITTPLPPGPLLTYLQTHGPVSDREAYRVWNMGHGMLVCTPQPDAVLAVAERHGITAQVVGSVTAERGIRLRSRGCFNAGELLSDPW